MTTTDQITLEDEAKLLIRDAGEGIHLLRDYLQAFELVGVPSTELADPEFAVHAIWLGRQAEQWAEDALGRIRGAIAALEVMHEADLAAAS